MGGTVGRGVEHRVDRGRRGKGGSSYAVIIIVVVVDKRCVAAGRGSRRGRYRHG